jgi:D-alanyl-D-alanine endopeptidase (penicillin-binding protein 7)
MRRIISLLLVFAFVFFSTTTTSNAQPVRITATSWLVADTDGNILQGNNTSQIRAIASITKLVTSMVVLDSRQSLDEHIYMKKFQKSLTRREVMELALVHSDNQAADALCQNYRFGYTACIHAMNIKMNEVGMHNTRFYDATGLSHSNVSTAEDLIKLVQVSHHYPEIIQAVQKGSVSVPAVVKVKHKKKKKKITEIKSVFLTFVNTNPLVRTGAPVTVSKTGFNNASGGCLVMQMSTALGERIVVVLGSRNTRTRFPEAEAIANKI